MVARLYMIVPSGYFDLMIQSGADGNLSSFNRSSESRSSVSSNRRPLGIPIQHLRPPSTQRTCAVIALELGFSCWLFRLAQTNKSAIGFCFVDDTLGWAVEVIHDIGGPVLVPEA